MCIVQRTPQAVSPYHLDTPAAQYPDHSQPLQHMQHNNPPTHPHLTSPHHPEPHAPVMNSSGSVDWPSTPREERGFVNSTQPTSARDYADMWSHGDPFGGHFLPFKPPPSTEWQVCWVVVNVALSCLFFSLRFHMQEPGYSAPPPSTNPGQQPPGSGNVRTQRAQQKAYSELARLAVQAEEAENIICGVGIELDLADDGNLVIISRILPGSVTAENGMLSEGDQVGIVDRTRDLASCFIFYKLILISSDKKGTEK